MQYKGIFFDFDGVVIENSQVVALEAMAEALSQLGLNLKMEYLIEHYMGVLESEVAHHLQTEFKLTLPDDFINTVKKMYLDRMQTATILGNNLTLILPLLEEKFICSSSCLDEINHFLNLKQIKNFFPDDCIFSRDKVNAAKPNPAAYLHALARSKLNKADCCAIEDSVVGVKAAKAAGLYTLAYVNGVAAYEQKKHAEALKRSGADEIISDFAECM